MKSFEDFHSYIVHVNLWPVECGLFWPNRHSLSNLGPLDDVISQLWNTGPWGFRQKLFKSFKIDSWKLFHDPYDLLMGLQPSRTVLTTLVGDHPRIIPVKFDQTPEKLKLYLSENVNKRQMMNKDWSQQLSLNMVCSGNLAKIKNMQWFKKLSIKLLNIHHTLHQRKNFWHYEIKIVPMFMLLLPLNYCC